MKIIENVSLKSLNTFGIDVKARFYSEIKEESAALALFKSDIFKENNFLILGGGSNVLFTKDFEGLVIKNNILEKRIVRETEDSVWLKSGAGESWHSLVLYAVDNGWGGIENMSLIPGTVGAAPMQNIGAYGVEIKDVFEELEAVNLSTNEKRIFTLEECDFGYRQSIFKNKLKNQFFISSVTLKLSRKPAVNTSYGAISQVLQDKGVGNPSIKEVSDAVIAIRQSKLPDPAKIGNAGSFFKNPTINLQVFNELKTQFPDIVGYENKNGVKVPAGWLIEHANWKGKKVGFIGVHEKQALVLVNYGGGKGADLYRLSEDIQNSVLQKYGILLEREVNIY